MTLRSVMTEEQWLDYQWFDPDFDCCDVNRSDTGLPLSAVLATLDQWLAYEAEREAERERAEWVREDRERFLCECC